MSQWVDGLTDRRMDLKMNKFDFVVVVVAMTLVARVDTLRISL